MSDDDDQDCDCDWVLYMGVQQQLPHEQEGNDKNSNKTDMDEYIFLYIVQSVDKHEVYVNITHITVVILPIYTQLH